MTIVGLVPPACEQVPAPFCLAAFRWHPPVPPRHATASLIRLCITTRVVLPVHPSAHAVMPTAAMAIQLDQPQDSSSCRSGCLDTPHGCMLAVSLSPWSFWLGCARS
jgi:hypothetical protein